MERKWCGGGNREKREEIHRLRENGPIRKGKKRSSGKIGGWKAAENGGLIPSSGKRGLGDHTLKGGPSQKSKGVPGERTGKRGRK